MYGSNQIKMQSVKKEKLFAKDELIYKTRVIIWDQTDLTESASCHFASMFLCIDAVTSVL